MDEQTAANREIELEVYRDTVIRPAFTDWDAQRSILRPAMIDIFVSQRIGDSDDWFARIPQYLRIGTNPEEKKRFLDDVCEIVDRIRNPLPETNPSQQIVNGVGIATANAPSATTRDSDTYTIADPTSVGHADRDRFFDKANANTVRKMIAHVIDIEGPLFEDVLIDRIARAHGLMHSGSQIRHRVVSLLPSTVTCVDDGDRRVIWPANKQPGKIHPFRRDLSGLRKHDDVPAEELASLALPFVRLRMDDETILRKMAEEFSLRKLREATRACFAVVLGIARSTAACF